MSQKRKNLSKKKYFPFRREWKINPRPRIKSSNTIYNRKKEKQFIDKIIKDTINDGYEEE